MAKGGYQKRRLQEKKLAEKQRRRRARRRKLLLTWAIVVGALGLASGVTFLALTGGGDAKPLASGSATASPITGCSVPGPEGPNGKQFKQPPKMSIDASRLYLVTLQTTCGPITWQLDPKLAPKTVNNIVFLVKQRFYDNTIFHRVQKETNFAIVQGGDPQGTGTGGPGYKYDGEKPAKGTKYKRGTLAMANSGDPSSNGSQFFIVVHDWNDLPVNYTVFGKVTGAESFRTLDRMILAQGEPLGNGLGIKPNPPIKITSAEVRAVKRR